MKSANVMYLRLSVSEGVWSNKQGANRVLQSAWEKKQEGAKIIFLFSITHRRVLYFVVIEDSADIGKSQTQREILWHG